MVIAGNELQDLPYGPGGHPDPRGVGEEDCSSTVNYVLYRSGVRPIARNPRATTRWPRTMCSWGAPGPGRWVTIYSTDEPTPHTFMTIAGLRLDTSHNGTDVGPNRDQDGPRWRILDHIPDLGPLVGAPPARVVRSRPMPDRKVDYLLIGGGLASANCARWLREEGADGEILLVGREPDAPYNRPDCSKGYLRGEESREEPLFRPAEFWEEQKIELQDAHQRDGPGRRGPHGEALEQGGDRVRQGADRHGRERQAAERRGLRAGADPLPAHARQRRRDSRGRRRRRERGPDRRLLHRLRGRCLADDDRQAVHDRHAGGDDARTGLRRRPPVASSSSLLEEHGVTVHGGDELERFEGEGRVGTSSPAAGWSWLPMPWWSARASRPTCPGRAKRAWRSASEAGLRCDSRLQSSAPGIYAAGDICEYGSLVHGGESVRIEHWDVAFNHGKTAALNMLGRDVAHDDCALLLLRAGRLGRTGVRRSGL